MTATHPEPEPAEHVVTLTTKWTHDGNAWVEERFYLAETPRGKFDIAVPKPGLSVDGTIDASVGALTIPERKRA